MARGIEDEDEMTLTATNASSLSSTARSTAASVRTRNTDAAQHTASASTRRSTGVSGGHAEISGDSAATGIWMTAGNDEQPTASAASSGAGSSSSFPNPANTLRPLVRTSTRALRMDSTRLRSNVADQVQRDLTPAGRLLSMILVLIEMFAEFAVLIVDRTKPCEAPLRAWLLFLIVLQGGTVLLNALSFALSHASSAPRSERPSSSQTASSSQDDRPQQRSLAPRLAFVAGTQRSPQQSSALDQAGAASALSRSSSWETGTDDGAFDSRSLLEAERSARNALHASALLRAVHTLNAAYLAWFVLGSIWVSDAGTCAKTAPNLYRLVLALTVIYYALLGLPLACFCLIMCCLPVFIRLMLPYAERAQRRGRSATSEQISSLTSAAFSEDSFAGLGDHSCVICLSNYTDGELVTTLPCNHHFHKKCIDEWLAVDKSCPLCKQDIDVPHSDV
eukprot:CAMPEP_0185850022 /NCGR_PEP_ID=MMETSP1354-20130828/4309_1 /TAXON_ID=708628 /ORGANISM="Erythrolobus madagascarensis, Strain CCMP3276" /LENGTH=449 /DNA_ID=CAMNT_0028550649 /DNA_START=157 /DNA_END=1506 /DNA_ORIENTATION=+